MSGSKVRFAFSAIFVFTVHVTLNMTGYPEVMLWTIGLLLAFLKLPALTVMRWSVGALGVLTLLGDRVLGEGWGPNPIVLAAALVIYVSRLVWFVLSPNAVPANPETKV